MTRILRRAWDFPAAPGAPARVWRDWALVGILALGAMLEALLRPDLPWRWPTLVLELGLIATLLSRRTHPGPMVVLAFGALVVMDTVRQIAGVRPTDSYALVAMLVLTYALVRWGSGRHLFAGGTVILLSMVRTFLADAADLQNVIGGIAVVGVCVSLGAAMRYRAAARLQRLAQVRLEEREHLARDLHDTVAHHVSAILLRAQAGLITAGTDPAPAHEALRVIEDEASQSLREMRSMVRVLRDDTPAHRSPTAGVAELRALANRDGEPPVTLALHGELDSATATALNAAYRIAQESVTNARRHAQRASLIELTVTASTDRIGIRIHDDGLPASAAGSGFGIEGMKERAALLGGTCIAGPDPDGGWTVTADLPTASATR
ncbi:MULTISPECIES: histidine kinase [unclassified Microbacterium]|uniref:sensor histidine kinase n=1 Tax=unclassified Microbacterium TaxID=2609290 RepID=UPI00214AB087|nr:MULTISPECIES: histidine kinase [unclassified Microbacterium]MCR2810658.1 histidine kinase [Microbacterium sp. zg.B185]WIM18195.1 histidine kinase [Microbacterium sp. zg-B185]